MARVSLILLRSPRTAWPAHRVEAYQAGLISLGFSVETLIVTDPSAGPSLQADEPSIRSVVAWAPGLAESAVTGLRAASGEFLVVLDLAMAYQPEDVAAVARELQSGEAELVIASRTRRWMGSIASRWLGTTDPTSGLLGVTRAAAVEADDSLAPVGSRFGLELLARVAGRRVDVPVGPVRASWRLSTPFGDLRQLKRLADDRFGNVSRLLQFCFVGASGMVVDLSLYAGFKALFARLDLFQGMTTPVVGGSMALAVAAVSSISIALIWNFTINRRLTFNDARNGSIVRQFVRYAMGNMLGIGLNLTLRLLLPSSIGFFSRHHHTAAVVGIVAATGINFSMARWFAFGPKPTASTGDRPARIARRRIAGFQSVPTQIKPRPSTRPMEG